MAAQGRVAFQRLSELRRVRVLNGGAVDRERGVAADAFHIRKTGLKLRCADRTACCAW